MQVYLPYIVQKNTLYYIKTTYLYSTFQSQKMFWVKKANSTFSVADLGDFE